MRSALATVANRRAVRNRSASILTAIPPSTNADDYLPGLAAVAASIVYRSPLPSPDGHPIFIINAAAFPDTFDVDYDSLLPYVLARLPDEDDLITGTGYEIIFFAGGQPEGATTEKKQGPGMGWYLQAYHVLSRAMRKRLRRLYIVHPRTWVRVLISVFSTIVSPKFRRKILHIGTLSALQQHLPIEDLLIPSSAFLHDRRLEAELESPKPGRAFGSVNALPTSAETGHTRLPKILRETTSFLLIPTNITTEGLFRIPPHALLASILRDAYDRGQKFLVWKEGDATFAQPDLNRVLLSEVGIEEAYGVNLAAALIKLWYRELREPIFSVSSYNYLREHFGDQKTPINLDQLVALIDPKSSLSVLTNTSREILTRHLLPLLHTVSSFQAQNKMSSSNIAICFAITLLRGPNQLEDAKASAIVQRLLSTAIEQWPELRGSIGIDEAAFLEDLRPPKLLSDYEDPLVSARHIAISAGQDFGQSLGDESAGKEVGDHDHSHNHKSQAIPMPKILQKFDVKLPPIVSRTPPVTETAKPPPPAVPKRKPARGIPITSDNVSSDPPQYSSLYGNADQSDTRPGSGHSEKSHEGAAATPYGILAHAVPSQTSSAQDSAEHAVPAQATQTVPTQASQPYTAPVQLPIIMPKRKALVAGDKADTDDENAHTTSHQTPDTQSAETHTGTREVRTSSLDSIAEDQIFRKPSWPASANRAPETINSLAKPVLPAMQRFPAMLASNNNLSASSLPKPRTPSPGLLLRMNSLDSAGLTLEKPGSPEAEKNYRLMPGKLSLRKASVDDLRRLYEERLDTIHGLARADVMKRSDSQP